MTCFFEWKRISFQRILWCRQKCALILLHFSQNNRWIIKVICIQHLYNLYCRLTKMSKEHNKNRYQPSRSAANKTKKKKIAKSFIKISRFRETFNNIWCIRTPCMFSISPSTKNEIIFYFYFLSLHHLPLLSIAHMSWNPGE